MAILQLSLAVLVIALTYHYMTKSPPRIVLDRYPDDVYDYVIVGGGSAGSVLASRLSEEKDFKVLLLEAGSHYDVNKGLHIPLMQMSAFNTSNDWEYYTEPSQDSCYGQKKNRCYWPRGRVLGGTSILNGAIYTRGSRFDFEEWFRSGCYGWSYEDVFPYFLKSEDIQIDDLKSSPYHSKGGPIAVSESYVTQLSDKYLKAGEELGYPVQDYNGKNLEGFSVIQKTIRNGVRSSTSLEYLGGTASRENLHISVNSHVTKVNIVDKKAVGVYYIRDGRKMYVKVRKEVILSGGAVNSPQLLMLSGIGPKHHLNEFGIKVISDLPVGENLQDHTMILLKSNINKPYSLTPGIIKSWRSIVNYFMFGDGPLAFTLLDSTAFLHFDKEKSGKTYPDMQLTFVSGLLRSNAFNFNDEVARSIINKMDNDLHGFITSITLSRPLSRGRIKLKSSDPFDHPRIEPNYNSDKRDIKAYVKAIRIWEKLMETNTFKDLGVKISDAKMPFCERFKFRSDEFWECVVRKVLQTVFHPTGTCKMGSANNPTAVVDPQLRVKGIQGLRVVDASIFPNITSGNTNGPTIMVAEKAADMIRGIDSVKQFRQNVPV
ncbi:glucose dehydrogenase [FAD, quinone]-like [Ruditapes philippinarum]|uniref:glucose dehydrogenase [FAD, quinone]-like n=1 Tax=Ruditapes philippinarum TaxID=129788 RepID=UPI00295ADE21|nr:glucose dehydrogenase [FAD, quinone]-like [Ruditapes philippinarum]